MSRKEALKALDRMRGKILKHSRSTMIIYEECYDTIRKALESKSVDVEGLGVKVCKHLEKNEAKRAMTVVETWFVLKSLYFMQEQGYLSAPQWQPIETAPKDGTTFMVWRKDHGGIWWGNYDGHKWLVVYGNNKVHAKDITHWMPLPQPPKENNDE